MTATLPRLARQRWLPLLEVTFITLLPVLLVLGGVIPDNYRTTALIGCWFTLPIVSVWFHRLSWKDLGVKWVNFRRALAPYVMLSGVLAAVLLTLWLVAPEAVRLLNPRVPTQNSAAVYLLVGVPGQQLLFFGWGTVRLRRALRRPLLVALLTALLFAVMHLLVRNPVLFAAALAVGVVWSLLYQHYGNLLAASFGHWLLVAVMLLLGTAQPVM